MVVGGGGDKSKMSPLKYGFPSSAQEGTDPHRNVTRMGLQGQGYHIHQYMHSKVKEK